MISKERLERLKRATPLLPDPGPEVVRELIAEIEESWHHVNDILEPERDALQARAEAAEAKLAAIRKELMSEYDAEATASYVYVVGIISKERVPNLTALLAEEDPS